jgi:hypothetical protein
MDLWKHCTLAHTQLESIFMPYMCINIYLYIFIYLFGSGWCLSVIYSVAQVALICIISVGQYLYCSSDLQFASRVYGIYGLFMHGFRHFAAVDWSICRPINQFIIPNKKPENCLSLTLRVFLNAFLWKNKSRLITVMSRLITVMLLRDSFNYS